MTFVRLWNQARLRLASLSLRFACRQAWYRLLLGDKLLPSSWRPIGGTQAVESPTSQSCRHWWALISDLEGGRFFFNAVKEGDSLLLACDDETEWHFWVMALYRATGQIHRPTPPITPANKNSTISKIQGGKRQRESLSKLKPSVWLLTLFASEKPLSWISERLWASQRNRGIVISVLFSCNRCGPS